MSSVILIENERMRWVNIWGEGNGSARETETVYIISRV